MSPPRKTALVTVGATAPFPALISASLDPTFLATLSSLGYSHLLIQHGLTPTNFGGTPSGQSLLSNLTNHSTTTTSTPLKITAFDLSANLSTEIAASDLIISHAGSGSILDALRHVKRLVVVPNEDLMDNHQKELARELEAQGYLVEGRVDNLPEAVKNADGATFKHFPRSESETFGRIVEEEMGFEAEG
ncbi:glycosyl transferase [Tirmania nivea]|nr:glycosyl transferase [Tirmania nivea]